MEILFRSLWKSLAVFQNFQCFLNGRVALVDITDVGFPAQNVIDDIAIQTSFQQPVRLADEKIASFYAFGIGKTHELFYDALVAEILQQTFLIFVFAQLRAVTVCVLETELQNQSFVADLYHVRRHTGSILWHKDVRHDAATAIYHSSQACGVAQTFVHFDTVF